MKLLKSKEWKFIGFTNILQKLNNIFYSLLSMFYILEFLPESDFNLTEQETEIGRNLLIILKF